MRFPRLLVSYGHARALRVVVVALLICTTLVTIVKLHHSRHPRQPSIYEYTEGRTSEWRDWRNKKNHTAAARPAEVKFLDYLIQKHGLTSEVTWSAKLMRPKYGGGHGRPSMTEIGAKFMWRKIFNARIQDAYLHLLVDKPALRLPVAGRGVVKGNQLDASPLLFGISTTYSRLIYLDGVLIKDWVRWLTDGNGHSNGASLLLTLQKSNQDEVDRIAKSLRSHGVDATVLLSDESGDSASRYLDLVNKLQSRAAEFAEKGWDHAKRYIALVDDDVFFPSMGRLVQRLSQFDPDEEYYVGAPSERSDWVTDGGKSITYGGGAVFLTTPMVNKLMQLPCLKSDPNQDGDASTKYDGYPTGAQWDFVLYECITRHSTVDLHVLPSFYNPEVEELYEDSDRRALSAEGYASGAQPLALHHYRNEHRFEAGKGHLVTSICGEDCFLQRFRFRDDWILVNGYSIMQYPDGVEAVPVKKSKEQKQPSPSDEEDDMDQKTVVGRRLVVDSPADDNYLGGGVKVIAWRGPKRTWRLLDAKVGDGGEVWQAYVKRRGGGNSFGEFDDRQPGDIIHSEEEKSDKDSVIVLIWEPSDET